MTSLHRSPLLVALVVLTGAIACSSSPSPSDADGEGRDDQDVKAAKICSPNAPLSAFCAPCGNGYEVKNGKSTCVCCAAPKPAKDAGATETCGDAPVNALCIVCPGGLHGFKQINGKATCECCASTAEICGEAPPVALCAACPGGIHTFKQINGKPTCECCSQ